MKQKQLAFTIARLAHGIQVDNFRDYISNIHQNFSDDAQKLQELYESASYKTHDPDYLNYLDDMISEQHKLLTVFQPSMYRKSTLVSLYSYLEHTLNSFCFTLHKMFNTKIEINDMKGDGIVRAKTFLSKIFGIDFGDANSKWAFLNDLNKIRNCIVHADSDLQSVHNPESIEKVISKYDGLKIVDNKFIDIDRNYIFECLENIDSFFIWLYSRHYDQ